MKQVIIHDLGELALQDLGFFEPEVAELLEDRLNYIFRMGGHKLLAEVYEESETEVSSGV